MDSETVHGTVRSGVTRVPEAGPLFWKRQKHGDGLPVLHPGQTGSSLPEKGGRLRKRKIKHAKPVAAAVAA